MGDAEKALPPSKKRSAGRELTKDNVNLEDEEDVPELETGTFKRASNEVLASRRIVKVRRSQMSSAPSSNPFAGINLVPPRESNATSTEAAKEAQASDVKRASDNGDGKDEGNKLSESRAEEAEGESLADEVNKQSENRSNETEGESAAEEGNKQPESRIDKAEGESTVGEGNAVDKDCNIGIEATETKEGKEEPEKEEKTVDEENKGDNSENVNSGVEGAPYSSFRQLSSSQNAFTGLAGTGISTTSFSFGTGSNDGSTVATAAASLFGVKDDKPFSLGLSNNGSSSIFGPSGASSTVAKSEGAGFPPMQEVVVETGEENEKVVFTADSVLFEFVDGGWKERGKGELKVNISTADTGRARILMRARGNYRLILNASLYPDMKLTNMDKKGITFACINSASESKDSLSTFALKFKDASIVEEFRSAVIAHKGKLPTVLKTPENSPKASDD